MPRAAVTPRLLLLTARASSVPRRVKGLPAERGHHLRTSVARGDGTDVARLDGEDRPTALSVLPERSRLWTLP